MRDNQVVIIKLKHPNAELTRNGTRKYRSRLYRPTNASWERLTAAINKRIKGSGVEFDWIEKAEVLL